MSKPWKVEMGPRTYRRKPKKMEGGPGEVKVQGAEISKEAEEKVVVEGIEGAEAAEGAVEKEGNQDL